MKRQMLFCVMTVLLAAHAIGQPTPVMRVGVVAGPATPTSAWLTQRPNVSANDVLQRDQLVRYLSTRKPDPKHEVKIEAVPLTSLDPNKIDGEARQKSCAYVVVLLVPRTSDAYAAEMAAVGQQSQVSLMTIFAVMKFENGKVTPLLQSGAPSTEMTAAQSVMGSVYSALVKASRL